MLRAVDGIVYNIHNYYSDCIETIEEFHCHFRLPEGGKP